MQLYSFKGDYPQPLPNKIRLSNGMVRTDQSTFTEEELKDAGYVAVTNRPDSNIFQQVVWRNFGWEVLDLSEIEIQNLKNNEWQGIRQKRNEVLQKTDWIIVKSLETGQVLSKEIVEYRQALRDITLQPDPFNIVWPQEPK